MVNSVDLSDHVDTFTLEADQGRIDITPLGVVQQYSYPGLQIIADPVITFYQDYATGKVYATLIGLWQNQTVFNIVAKADAGARTLTNPEWTVPVFLANMPIMMGKRGSMHMAPVTLAPGGLATILTS